MRNDRSCAAVIQVLVNHGGGDKMPSYVQIAQEMTEMGLPTSATQAGSFLRVDAKKGWVDLTHRMATPLGAAEAAAILRRYDMPLGNLGKFEKIPQNPNGIQKSNLGSQ